MEWLRKKVVVLGMARSGVAAARTLCRLGADVTISDLRSREELGETLAPLADMHVTEALGCSADDALRGKELLVISPGVPYASADVARALEWGIPVIGELELGAELTKGRLIAITGTNGKTTTTTLVGEIFRAMGRHCHVCGNIGYPITMECLDSRPDDVTVAEVSSYQCESITDFHPDVGAILNISEDHIARHGSMETYIAMKERIFRNQTPKDVAVLNWDDPVCREIGTRVHSHVAWFSRRERVPYGAYVEDGTVFLAEEKHVAVCRTDEIRIPGNHNLENALAAIAISGALGAAPERMREVLAAFPGVEHRIETVRELDGVTWINDSKGTNVDSTLKAIDTMTKPTVLILGGSDKKVSFVPLAEAIVHSPNIRFSVLMGDTAPQIRKALEDAGCDQYVMTDHDLDACLSEARKAAVTGGNVLFSPACASFDMFRDFEDRGRIFKEKVLAMEPRS